MSKKIFLIFGAIFVMLLIVIVIQLFGQKNQLDTEKQPNGTDRSQSIQNIGTQQNIGNTKMKPILQGPILGPILAADGNKILYYQDKKVLTTDFEGTTKNSIGAYPFDQARSFEWSAKKDLALVNTPSGYLVYSLNTDEATRLPEGVDVATWSLKGDKLIYKFFNKTTGERSINMSDPNGSNWQKLMTIPFKKIDFQIQPGSGTIYYHQTPDSFAPTELDSVDFSGSNHKKIFEGKYGADFLWAPNGRKLLVSFVIEKGGRRTDLAVMNANGGEFRTMDFPTVVDKCVWAKDSVHVYCGFMVNVPADAVMPNHWQEMKFQSVDTFWKINTDTGKKDRLIEIQDIPVEIDAVDFFLDNDEKYLFFLDRTKGDLYRITL